MYQVALRVVAPEYERFLPAVEAAVSAALGAEGAPGGSEVAVVLTGDEEIAEYHERFMAIPGPTDVISWPSGAGWSLPEPFLGDVMVSCEIARRQADSLGHSWEREVAVLAVHGTLHLLGWDDATPEEQAAMQSRVDAIVDGAGVGGR